MKLQELSAYNFAMYMIEYDKKYILYGVKDGVIKIGTLK